MTVNRDEIFYELFGIKGEDRSLLPENIGNNFIMNKQSYLLEVIGSDEEMFEKYKKAFNREDDTEVRGLCSYLCAYVARHNLLANKDTFSEKFFDLCTLGEIKELYERLQELQETSRFFDPDRTLKKIKEARKRLKESEELEKSLIDDLMNEAKIGDQYYADVESQNSQAAF